MSWNDSEKDSHSTGSYPLPETVYDFSNILNSIWRMVEQDSKVHRGSWSGRMYSESLERMSNSLFWIITEAL